MNSTLALVGQTASGKTSIAAGLAPELDAEILCADSMTVYRGMDIGTAKPQADQRARVRHHLLDIAVPGEQFSVATFQRHARAASAEIRDRGKRVMVVGGSGLFFRATVDDLSFPPTDHAVRARLTREPLDELASRLNRLDPKATFVDHGNKRRVVRALEVIELTGKPFSSFRDEWGRRRDVVAAGLVVSRGILEERTRARLGQMLMSGLLDEVRELVARGHRDAVLATRAIGYAEAIGVLDGTLDKDQFIDEAARATRRLARRQMSWFRADPRVVWFDADDTLRAAAEVRAYYSERLQGG